MFLPSCGMGSMCAYVYLRWSCYGDSHEVKHIPFQDYLGYGIISVGGASCRKVGSFSIAMREKACSLGNAHAA